MDGKHKALSVALNYLLITAGCFAYALAFSAFFHANAFAMGGATGVGQILARLSGGRIPVGLTILALNLPLFLLAARKQGLQVLFSTLYAVLLVSVFIDGITSLWAFPPMKDPLLACVFGSIFMGASLGFLMLRGATTGGTELLARLLKYRFRHFSIGRLCLIIDVAVVCLYGLTFGRVLDTMYGIIAMYISSRVIDTVVYGPGSARLAIIVSDQSDRIIRGLLDKRMGVTLLEGTGAFSRQRKNVVLCVFKRNRIAEIKSLAKACDPMAFVIVCEANEVLGEGFGQYSEDDL